jgi:hypothetical protein
MYREGPTIDRSSLIQQASTAIMMAKQLVELFVASTDRLLLLASPGQREEVSSLIAQADQIYSSLWTQLDQASHCIAGLQRDTTEYRTLRAELGGGTVQGILDVSCRIERRGRYDVMISTVVTNRVGLQHAAAACRMLVALVPEVDWATQIKKQAATPMIDLRQGTNRLVWGTIIAFVGVLAYLLLR